LELKELARDIGEQFLSLYMIIATFQTNKRQHPFRSAALVIGFVCFPLTCERAAGVEWISDP
jgi:hypothetical protein